MEESISLSKEDIHEARIPRESVELRGVSKKTEHAYIIMYLLKLKCSYYSP